MINDIIAKSMVNNVVKKGIRDIQHDSRRSIRKLIDLGLAFSKGESQKEFFTMAQEFLTNESSAYYMFLTSLVNNVNSKNLQIFGIDVGYMSWSFGTKHIRNFEERNGYFVPWTIFVDMSSSEHQSPPLQRIVSEAQRIGIYTYFIELGDNKTSFCQFIEIAGKNPDSAFVVISKTDYSCEMICHEDTLPPNVMVVINSNCDRFFEFKRSLDEKHVLKGVCRYYDDDNYEEILTGEVTDDFISEGNNIIFFIEDKNCPKKISKKVYDYVVEVRNEQTYPAFIMDLYNDVAYADRTISEGACLLGIHSDGNIYTSNSENTGININSISMTQAIKRTMPHIDSSRTTT